MTGLNGHNAKVYSGIEQVFVVMLSELDKVRLIRKFYKGVYYNDTFIVNKLAFNRYNPGAALSHCFFDDYPDKQPDSEDDINKAKLLFEDVFVIPIDPKKSKFNSKTQGEYKGKSYETELSIYVRGMGRISAEFFNNLVDREIAVIFKDANQNFRMLFDPIYPVETDTEQDSGEGLASDAGFSVTFKNQSKVPPIWIYGKFNVISGYLDIDGEIKKQPLVIVETSPRPDTYLDKQDYMFQLESVATGLSGV